MDTVQTKKIIGSAEQIRFPELKDAKVHARVDSGARTSAVWGDASVNADGHLEVVFFGDSSHHHTFTTYGRIAVATSTGQIEKRFTVRMLAVVKGRKIRATFTIANRASQVYPVLIGRNILRGKFVVDVKKGKKLASLERQRITQLQSTLQEEGDI